ncbi:MAG: nucleoside-diphosphate kinase [Candidatus Marinimicrobia bacterium]|nr:nucleoside-diphosphate kinase [Candidatus Neomarinimicrobiota bacterium]
MIKPDAVGNAYTGKIIDHILTSGFEILGMKVTKMTKAVAEAFYEVHAERPFYGELTEFMSSGPTVVLALKKDNAVPEWRKTIGATDPKEADTGTIRKLYAENKGRNAVHGSDSDENAEKEIAFFFTNQEIILNKG